MAVTSLWAVKGSVANVIRYVANPEKTWNINYGEAASYHALENVLQYTVDAMKTEKQLFVSGIRCSADPKQAAIDFQQVKKQHNKEGGVVCFHGYQAFQEGEVTPEKAHEIGIKLAQELWGDKYQVLVTTHINTGKIHNHFCLNSVAQVRGKRFDNSHKDYYRMREVSDRLCKEYGLSVTAKDRNINENRFIWNGQKEGRNGTFKSLYVDLDTVLSYATSFKEFTEEIQNCGYLLEYRGSFLRIRADEGKKFYRLDRLGEGYSEAEIRERCYENYLNRPKKPWIMTERPKWKKSTGIIGLYRHYVYLLHHFPKTARPYSREAYVSMREDSKKATMYSEEAILLAENKIETANDLTVFTTNLGLRFKELAYERAKLRNRLRRMHDSDEMQPLKERVYELSNQMKELRKEMKLCEDIAERSSAVEAVVNEIDKYPNEEKHKSTTRKERESER